MSEVIAGGSVVGLEFEGFLVDDRGFLELAFSGERIAKVEIGLGVVGLQDDRGFKLGQGNVEVIEFVQHHTQVIVGFGVIRIGGNRVPIPGDRFIRSARAMTETAHQIQNFGPLGFDLEDLATPPLRSLQVPGLSRLEGLVHRISHGCHREIGRNSGQAQPLFCPIFGGLHALLILIPRGEEHLVGQRKPPEKPLRQDRASGIRDR
jgi:hypothetical protein